MLLQEIEKSYVSLKESADFSASGLVVSELEKSLHVANVKQEIPYQPSLLADIMRSMQQEDAERLRKILILGFAVRNWDDFFSQRYPQSVQEQYEQTLQRIYDTCQSDIGWSDQNPDVYWKDLGMLRQIVFPAGAQIVEFYSSFSVRQALTRKIGDSLGMLGYVLSRGGNKAYFQIHTHTPELKQFNESGWNDCYVRIAEMLEIHTDINGMFGGSWFYDPSLESISPNLHYLRKTPIENGALNFYVGKDNSGNAIATSKTRKKLYDQGQYVPASYMLVWPRKELIAWANQYKQNTG